MLVPSPTLSRREESAMSTLLFELKMDADYPPFTLQAPRDLIDRTDPRYPRYLYYEHSHRQNFRGVLLRAG